MEPEKRDDIQEVFNYHLAMETAVSALKERPLCTNTICDLHRILLNGVRESIRDPEKSVLGWKWPYRENACSACSLLQGFNT
jgi:hypothetical protein